MFNTILVIVTATLSVSFILFLLGRYIYKRMNGLPTGDCAYCKVNTKKMLKQYRKKYSQK